MLQGVDILFALGEKHYLLYNISNEFFSPLKVCSGKRYSNILPPKWQINSLQNTFLFCYTKYIYIYSFTSKKSNPNSSPTLLVNL